MHEGDETLPVSVLHLHEFVVISA